MVQRWMWRWSVPLLLLLSWTRALQLLGIKTLRKRSDTRHFVVSFSSKQDDTTEVIKMWRSTKPAPPSPPPKPAPSKYQKQSSESPPFKDAEQPQRRVTWGPVPKYEKIKSNSSMVNKGPVDKDFRGQASDREKDREKDRDKDKDKETALVNPKVLITYRTPREISEKKQHLLSQQATLKEASAAVFDAAALPLKGSSRKVATFSDSISSRIPSKGGPTAMKRKANSEKPDSGAAKPSRKLSRVELDDETANSDGDDNDGGLFDHLHEGLEGGGPLAVDEDELMDLSDVEDSELLAMLKDELEVDEIMNVLATEYGISTSFRALKARLADAKRTLTQTRRTGKTRRERYKQQQLLHPQRLAAAAAQQNDANLVRLPLDETIAIQELSSLAGVPVGALLKQLMVNEGLLINLNQVIARDVAVKLLTAMGKVVEDEDELVTLAKQVAALERSETETAAGTAASAGAAVGAAAVSPAVLAPRPPVVTIMGHVDHGKTTLLDRIRHAQVAQHEAGGITQSISAFHVQLPDPDVAADTADVSDSADGGGGGGGPRLRSITFVDTPGHAAFAQMRQRGARLTDIVVLVIAADDGVMEQTRECIAAAVLAHCPIVIALNKVDKVSAERVEKVKQDLFQEGLLLEEYGGETQLACVSAKTGDGVAELLAKISVQAEVMALTARVAGGNGVEGLVVESSVDKGLGVVVTALIQQGTLRVGDTVVCGTAYGRVRRLVNDQGQAIAAAGPSTPVRIVGMNRLPQVGDAMLQATDEDFARTMAEARLRFTRDRQLTVVSAQQRDQSTAALVNGTVDSRERVTIPVVLKADVGGSLEALVTALEAIRVEDATTVGHVEIVYRGVGDVTTSDVGMAASTRAQLVAFNVAATVSAHEEARARNVDIAFYAVVYDLLDAVRRQVEASVTPPPPGDVIGRATILKTFSIGRTGKVAGCVVDMGRIVRNTPVRVLRGKVPRYVGMLATLKVMKDDRDEVSGAGAECGMGLRGFEDFAEGDVIECFLPTGTATDPDHSDSAASNSAASSGGSGSGLGGGGGAGGGGAVTGPSTATGSTTTKATKTKKRKDASV